jgi:pyocin large subunit-like protein
MGKLKAGSPEEYLQMARDFWSQAKTGKFQVKWDQAERTLRFYDAAGNKFWSFRLDGTIRTFMKPRGNGQKYFDSQRGVKLTPLEDSMG